MSHKTTFQGPGERAIRSIATGLRFCSISALVTGVVAIVWPGPTLLVMTILLGAYLVASGLTIVGLTVSNRHEPFAWWTRLAFGAGSIAGGIIIWAWPDTSAFAVAMVLGAIFLIWGLTDIAVAMMWRLVLPGSGWLLAAGAISLGVGFATLAWPEITVLALLILTGSYLIVLAVLGFVTARLLVRAADDLHFGAPIDLRTSTSDSVPWTPFAVR